MLKKIVTPDGETSLERIDLSKTISADSITHPDAPAIPVTGILPDANIASAEIWNDKQDKLTAGENIQINDNVISATDTIYDDTNVKQLITNETNRAIYVESNLQQQINAQRGQGGALSAFDFGVPSDQVTMEMWLAHAMSNIWGGIEVGSDYTLGIDSYYTYLLPQFEDPITHKASDIFNATWVTNLYDNNMIQLANTPDTAPPVFDIAVIGNAIVSQATNDLLGIAKGKAGDHAVNEKGEIYHDYNEFPVAPATVTGTTTVPAGYHMFVRWNATVNNQILTVDSRYWKPGQTLTIVYQGPSEGYSRTVNVKIINNAGGSANMSFILCQTLSGLLVFIKTNTTLEFAYSISRPNLATGYM